MSIRESGICRIRVPEYTRLDRCAQRMLRPGVTLPELLVVIAIISLLMSFLMTALGRAKENGWAAKCAANLRSVGHTIHAFAEAHEDRPAPTVWQRDTHWGRGPQIGWDIESGTWANVFGGPGSIWQCPRQRTPFVGNARALGTDRRELGEPRAVPTRSRWHDPARLALCYDLQYDLLNGLYAHALKPDAADLSDEYYRWPLEGPFIVGLFLPQWGPHVEQYGVAFADGHSETGNFTEQNARLWSGAPWWPEHLRKSPTSAGTTD